MKKLFIFLISLFCSVPYARCQTASPGTTQKLAHTSYKIIYTPGLKVYPNPSEEAIKFLLDSTEFPVNFSVKIFDSFGRLVLRQTVMSSSSLILNKTDFGSGIYFYKVEGENGFLKLGKICFK